MKTTKIFTILVLTLGLAVWQARVSEAAPLGTAWTYQGRLIDANSPADGLYDFQFKLFNDPCDPCDANQVGGDISIPDLDVIDGQFAVELDFGSDVFNGDSLWLEIGVRPGDSSGSFTTLSPRQEITSVPYALQTRGIFVDDVPYIIDYPDTWTVKESNRIWQSVAMSADGTKQTAVVWGGQIYISTDSGNTWTAKESTKQWFSVAMSADGTKQTAVVAGGQIYVSTDSGNTWIAKESNRDWQSVAMSADGTKQTAVVHNGQIYVSTDSGNTWTAKESNRRWFSVAMSADGIKQTAVVYGGWIYVSTDSGNTWTPKGSNRWWYSVAMSVDGTKQTAVVYNGQIYVSTDSGNTWTPKESNRSWQSVAMSADGTNQTVVVDRGQIYVSTDSGNTWTAKESNRWWQSVAMSADGTKQTAVVEQGQIYICRAECGYTYNVGIGTTSPTSKFHVVGDLQVDSSEESHFITGDSYVFLQPVADDRGRIGFYDSSSGWLNLTLNEAGGNVGIGTTSPSAKLDVNGDAAVTGNLAVSGNFAAGGVTIGKVYLTGSGTIISNDGGNRILSWDKTDQEIEITNNTTDWCDYWWQAQKGGTTSGSSGATGGGTANVVIISGTNTNDYGFEVHFGQADGTAGWCSVWLQYANNKLVGHYISY